MPVIFPKSVTVLSLDKSFTDFFCSGFIYPEDGSSRILQNFSIY